MISAGALIWVSIRPLLRLVICTGAGVAVSKADVFPPVAARGAAQIALRITLPALMFSKIVPAFNEQNIAALGPLTLVSLLYIGIGIVMSWITKQLFWVPHRFRYGILVAGGWSNWGDIPTSVVLSITASLPFRGQQDSNLAVAYVSAFILIFMLTLFPLGGQIWVAKDFNGPDIEDDEVREAVRLRRLKVAKLFGLKRRREAFSPQSIDVECAQGEGEPVSEKGRESFSPQPTSGPEYLSGPSSYTHKEDAQTETHVDIPPPSKSAPATPIIPPIPPAQLSIFKRVRTSVLTFLSTLLSPACLSILISFVISLIPPVKALFVVVAGSKIPMAPDGQPPLAFIMDAATFIGAASVPIGLFCLGSALSRLQIPKNWSSLPVGAIISMAVLKTLVSPVFGVLICRGLVHAGVMDGNDKVLMFVCIFFSCLPAATSQVFLTQIHSGTGSAEHLSAFLLPQYFLMLFSMPALIAYSLHLLF